jgi:putative transposase
MARRHRDFIPGYSYHLTQRGNRKTEIFLDDTDRRVYLRLLVAQCLKHRVRIWAYSLMSNHVHHVAVPDQERALSRAFKRIFGEYARYFNTRYVKTGHLFQGRFNAVVLDEPHLWNAVAYVERNPVRAGIVSRAEDYRWSSAAAHCGLRTDPVLSLDVPLIPLVSDWSKWLAKEERIEDLEFIRQRTRTGRPCASDEFTRMLEAKLGRPLLPRKPGPKKRDAEDNSEGTWLFDGNWGIE